MVPFVHVIAVPFSIQATVHSSIVFSAPFANQQGINPAHPRPIAATPHRPAHSRTSPGPMLNHLSAARIIASLLLLLLAFSYTSHALFAPYCAPRNKYS